MNILDSLDVGVAVIDRDGIITEWSEPAAYLIDRPRDQIVGQPFRAALPATPRRELESAIAAVLAGGEARAVVVPLRSGERSETTLVIRVSPGPGGQVVLMLRELHADVLGELGGGNRLLQTAEGERRNYELLFRSLPTVALVLDVDGRIVEANAAASELFALTTPAALRGAALDAWLPAGQRPLLQQTIHQAIAAHRKAELTFELSVEPPREIRAMVAPADPMHATNQAILVAVEVSREVLLQRKLLRSDRLSQLGAIVSGVAHELNNPLAAIAAFSELLAGGTTEPSLKDSAQIIHSEAMRAGRIVQTLLDFARQRPRRPQPVDLVDIVERVLTLQRSALKKARVRVEVRIPAEVPPITGDPQELQQVLLNAVINALQAITGTGRPGRIVIHASPTDHHVLLTVDDTGPGVPVEVLERAFEPFFTTKEAGTGLGLAISLGLVKGMGGRMWLQNVEQGGARLAIELPAGQGLTPPNQEVITDSPSGALRVLVVDDDPAVRRGMVLMAERLGHAVAEAAGFDEAVERLQSGDARFDALLLDVHLDDAHTGFELFSVLMEEGGGRERHVVFTTGDSISTQTRDQLERSGRPVLRKPFSLDDLRDVLGRASHS
ncbi:MAG TPA: ATP-binding protein [Gemmatimonadales bacterium]|nr:ATP-binding protein [Gemmatimonadales bacterium]